MFSFLWTERRKDNNFFESGLRESFGDNFSALSFRGDDETQLTRCQIESRMLFN